MQKTNTKKYIYIFAILTAFSSIFFAFQNFTSLRSEKIGEKTQTVTEDALSAALRSAEADHSQKQVALNVDPDHIEKTSLNVDRRPQTIEVESDHLTEAISDSEMFQPDDGKPL